MYYSYYVADSLLLSNSRTTVHCLWPFSVVPIFSGDIFSLIGRWHLPGPNIHYVIGCCIRIKVRFSNKSSLIDPERNPHPITISAHRSDLSVALILYWYIGYCHCLTLLCHCLFSSFFSVHGEVDASWLWTFFRYIGKSMLPDCGLSDIVQIIFYFLWDHWANPGYFEIRIPLKPALGSVCSFANYSYAYEETLSYRVSDFRKFLCSLFPKAILFYFYFPR